MNELATLRDLLDEGRVKLGIHLRAMNTAGSPAFRWQETIAVPLAILAAAILALRFVHLYASIAVLVAGMWYWIAVAQPRAKSRVFDRSAALALASEAAFDSLWQKGILTLFCEMPDGTQRAATRRDDWRRFVREVAAAT